MTVGRPEHLVLGDSGTALGVLFQECDLLFERRNKGRRVVGAVLRNVVPDLRDVGLGGGRELNEADRGHV